MATKKTLTLTATSLGAVLFAGMKRLRRRTSASALHDLGSPRNVNEPVRLADPDATEGHAPGHRHLAPPPAQHTARLSHRADRRWANARRRSSGRTP